MEVGDSSSWVSGVGRLRGLSNCGVSVGIRYFCWSKMVSYVLCVLYGKMLARMELILICILPNYIADIWSIMYS